MMCLINFNDAGLVILPTHRLMHLSVDTADLLEKLRNVFNITKKTPREVEELLGKKHHSTRMLGMYLGKGEGAYLLTLKNPTVLESIVPENASQEWRTLPVNLLYYAVLKNVININDEDFQTKITYSHSFQETLTMVDKKEASFAFLVPSCTKQELEKVTQAHAVMPQKSTYFFPKIYSGFVLYDHTK